MTTSSFTAGSEWAHTLSTPDLQHAIAEREATIDMANRYNREYTEALRQALTERIKARLEELREAIHDEHISYGELAELQSLSDHIANGDVELLEWAGVSEEDARAEGRI